MVPAYLVLGIWLLEQILLFPESMKMQEEWQLLPILEDLQEDLYLHLYSKRKKLNFFKTAILDLFLAKYENPIIIPSKTHGQSLFPSRSRKLPLSKMVR